MDWVIVFQTLGLLLSIVVLHSWEYRIQMRYHPSTSTDQYVQGGLVEYMIALSCGYLEYAIERYFFPFKSDPHSPFIWIGAAAMLVGMYIRLGALLTAGKSFNHFVQTRKKKSHVLIKHGLYKYIRHPGYLGYFIFALGTQTLLQNPAALVGFTIVLWRFFDDRIRDEEAALLEFFTEYKEYREKTPTWIPFIK